MDWFWTVWAWLSTPVAGTLAVGAGLLSLALYGLEKTIGLTWRYHRWQRSRRYRRDLTRPSPDAPRNVIGRQGDVAALRRVLTETGTGVITPVPTVTGGAGIGKTTLARHYAATHGADYDFREIIPADTQPKLATALAALGDRLLGEASGTPPQTRARQALDEIARRAQSERWLLIYDNVETPAGIEGWLAEGRYLHVLITTRCPDWPGARFRTHQAGVLSVPDAVALLEQESGRKDAGFADLAKDLGYLPLALVQAGDWLAAHPGTSVAAYRKRLDQLLDDWPLQPGEVRDYPLPAGAAVRLSIRGLSPDARALLGVMAWFDPDRIARQVFEVFGALPFPRWWQGYGRGSGWALRAICANPERLQAALQELRRSALIEDTAPAPHQTDPAFALHRIVQRVARRDLGRQARPGRAVALLAAVYPGHVIDSGSYPLCARLTPHVRALMDSGAAPPVAAWNYLLNQAGNYLDVIADYPGCLMLAQATLTATKQRGLPESDRDLAVAHANLGMAWGGVGDLEAAEQELNRARELDQQHRPGSADHADHLDLLGGLMLNRVRAGESDRLVPTIRLYQQALAIRRRVDRRSADVAAALNNLGGARDLQGRKRAAARLQGAALAIRRAVLAPGDARLATSAMNVGSMRLELGTGAEAEDLLREALEIREAVFADQPDHPARRIAAGWLISCLLVRARQGVNRGMREAEARRLCGQYGFDYDERVARARDYPDAPLP